MQQFICPFALITLFLQLEYKQTTMKTLTSILRNSAFAVLAAIGITSCSEEQFHINGNISDAKDSTLYFENLGLEGLVVIDSVKLNEEGCFEFSHNKPLSPEFYRLRIANKAISLSVDSTETITVKASYPTMATKYEVSGSEECLRMKELSLMQIDLQNAVYSLDKNQALDYQTKADSMMKLVNAYKNGVKTNYIFKNPRGAASYFALFQTVGNYLIFNPQTNKDDIKAFAAVATSWDVFYPEALRTKNLHNIAIKGINNDRIITYENNKTIDPAKIVESNIIDITMPDNKGNKRSLTDLKGKVVMLDFHVFGMKESPERILIMRELYNKYHDKGFEIYQVSLDANEHFWKQQTANLPWISVRDKDGISSSILAAYNIHSIPEYFLIDRSNGLVSRSQQIEDMEKAIEELL